jgi:hypothetical protein
MRLSLIMVGTFVFGIVPGTLLVVLAVLFGTAPAVGLLDGDVGKALLAALFTIPVAVMAVLGYAALFYAAGDELTPRTARWLLAGITANLVGIGLVAIEPDWSLLDGWYLYFPPLAVGGAHFARFLLRSRLRRASV